MRPIDIRKYKQDIRVKARAKRNAIDPAIRQQNDIKIAENVRKLHQYASADTILVYVSTPIEINTEQIIKNAWADSKKVAVPRCITGTRDMEFHYINSFDDLSPGTFYVLEPPEDYPIVTDFTKCLMLLPSITVDVNGYRLGYGMGYYDRYMSRYTGFSAVLCYSDEIRHHLYHGRFDQPANAIVSEQRIKTCKRIQPKFKGSQY